MKKLKTICISTLGHILSLGIVLSLMSCKDEDKHLWKDYGELSADESIEFPSGGGQKEVEFETDLALSSLDFSITSSASSWCKVVEKDDKIFVQADSNMDPASERIAVLTILSETGVRQDVTIRQNPFSLPDADAFDPLTIFTDYSCSAIRSGVTEDDIINIPEALYKNIAVGLRDGNYENKEYRIQSYRPYQTPSVSVERTKTMHTWGILDNITGMYVEDEDDEICILVGDTHGQTVKLRVQHFAQSWGANPEIDLEEGVNIVKPGAGLCYIILHVDEYLPLVPQTQAEIAEIESKSVTIHFAYAKVNGYYDVAKNTGADSPALIANAGHRFFDIKGKYSHVVWSTEDFREYNTDFSETMKWIDRLTELEIEFAGFFKYGGGYSTRMLFMPIASGSGNPNATVARVLFPGNYRAIFANPSEATFRSHIWGLAHEVGHCSQSNPGMRWGGMGEVGNNMFSMYVKTQVFGYEGSNLLVEGYYDSARALIIDTGIPHADPGIYPSKHMERLVPFWQVELYMTKVMGKEDFNKDLYQHYRVTENIGTTFLHSGPLQLDYIRNVCNIGQVNLLDFFEKWGFLIPVDQVVSDYGDRTMKITQEDIDELIAEIEAKNYFTPTKDITLIRDDNFEEFREN